MLDRARTYGLKKLIVTGSDLEESKKAFSIARNYRVSRLLNSISSVLRTNTHVADLCRATIGVHPCSAVQFLKDPTGHLDALRNLIIEASAEGTVAAIGEIGLDYDRLFLTEKEPQLKYFEAQLSLAVSLHQSNELKVPIPLFLHSRAAADDFERLLKPALEHLPARGIVHSFTGSVEEMQRLVDLGLDIGVNGCSLKTAENLEVIKAIPLERMQLETDGPWCEIRPSSAGMATLTEITTTNAGEAYRTKDEILGSLPRSVKKEKWDKDCVVKGRNEPCMIGLVAEVVARMKGVTAREVSEAAWKNSCRMFGLDDTEGAGMSPTNGTTP